MMTEAMKLKNIIHKEVMEKCLFPLRQDTVFQMNG